MRFEYTDGCNKDFIELCHELDDFLNELVGAKKIVQNIFHITNLMIFMM